MAISAGVFTATALQKSRVHAAQMFGNPTWTKAHQKKLTILDAIASRQNINITEANNSLRLLDNTICPAATVVWLNDCDTSTIACGTAFVDGAADCTFTGTEIGSDSLDYTTDCLYVVERAVVNSRCKDEHDFIQKLAVAEQAAKFNLDNALETGLITDFEANKFSWTTAGFNPNVGTVDGGDAGIWNVPAANIDSAFIAQLQIVAEKAKMADPVIISGGGLKTEYILAAANAGIATTYHSDRMFDSMPFYFNLTDVNAVSTQDSMYLVDAGAVGFINSNDYMNAVPNNYLADKYSYYTTSDRINWANGGTVSPIKYDVRTHAVCTNQNEVTTHFQYKASGAYIENPAACSGEVGNVFRIDIT